jgi:hypothetical protein
MKSSEVIKEKKIAYRRGLNIKSIQDKTNYKQIMVTANRETRIRKNAFMGEIYITDRT